MVPANSCLGKKISLATLQTIFCQFRKKYRNDIGVPLDVWCIVVSQYRRTAVQALNMIIVNEMKSVIHF